MDLLENVRAFAKQKADGSQRTRVYLKALKTGFAVYVQVSPRGEEKWFKLNLTPEGVINERREIHARKYPPVGYLIV